MEASQHEIIKELRKKIYTIISMCDRLRAEKEQWLHEKKELIEKLKIKDKEYIEIEHKFDQLKVAKLLLSNSGDAQEARQKVNRLVREIDKCIALLNR